jgi:hypothetical protein
MLSKAIVAGLVVAGVINLLPLSGVLGRSWLTSLYGLEIGSADLEILLRHRAVLFGILGALLLASVFIAGWRSAAVFAAALSMASFIVVALIVGGYGPPIRTIIVADVIGLVALAPAVVQMMTAPR